MAIRLMIIAMLLIVCWVCDRTRKPRTDKERDMEARQEQRAVQPEAAEVRTNRQDHVSNERK